MGDYLHVNPSGCLGSNFPPQSNLVQYFRISIEPAIQSIAGVNKIDSPT